MTGRLGRWVLVVAVAVVLVGGLPGLAALRAAGLNGTAPPGAAAFKQLISTLTSNWEWLIGTGRGPGAGADRWVDDRRVGQRAPDHLFRVIGGIMLILIVIPAVLA